jgi:hypothetical protein
MKLLCSLLVALVLNSRISIADGPYFSILDKHLIGAAQLIVRARVFDGAGGSKYLWTKVDILSVIKTLKNVEIPSHLSIAYHSYGPGLPVGVSTLYLVPYNPEKPEYGWKLLEEWAAQSKTFSKGYSNHVEDK